MIETPKLHLPRKFSAEPIAIVGLGCVFPDASNINQFWQNIVTGKNSIIEVPKDRWDPDLYYDPDPSTPDKTYTKIGGFVTDFKLNPIEYRIPPNVLEQIDPVQQWALASAKEALEDAGYEKEDFPRERCAVILGNSLGGEKSFEVSQRVYFPAMVRALKTSENFNKLDEREQEQLIKDLEEKYKKNIPVINEDSMPGELANIVAGRIAATFNLRGKNQTTDAACASSLAAIDTAFKGLQAHEFDAAVVGGADRSNDPPSYVKFSKIGALSADGSFPFDERANGFVPGEGAGVMVVKRLSDALAAGDKIYALITGVGASSDGKGKGITAPNPIGQELAVRRALESADITPSDIQLIEAHGTSTSVGDFVEVSTAEKIYREAEVPPQSVRLGSIKSQIGHLKSAAGAAGLVKTALSLHHKIFPPSINFETPNPKIDWETSPFVVNTHPVKWDVPDGKPRRAGVSSFGFGGTNFHVIMEEYDPQRTYDRGVEIYGSAAVVDDTETPDYVDYVSRNRELEFEPILLSASSVQQAQRKLDLLPKQIGSKTVMDDITEPPFAQKISSLHFDPMDEVRVGISPSKLDDLASFAQLARDALADKTKRAVARARGVFVSEGLPGGKLAFVFPGQGSQYADMLEDLCRKYSIIEETFAEADEILGDMLDKPLREYILSGKKSSEETEEELRQTQITQPAVLTVDIALYRLFSQFGIHPDMVAGHSLGEYAALVAAGVLSFEDALRAVAIRGKAMSEVDFEDKGTMASISTDVETIEDILDDIDGYVIAANKNSLSTTVISGSTEGVQKAIKAFEEKGINAIPLSVSAAFHTTIVEPAAEPLSEFLDSVTFNPPDIHVTSNVTGEFFPDDPDKIRELMKQQVGAAVEWTPQIQHMYDQGATRFFEVGPKRALSTFVDDILADKKIITVICNHPKKGGIKTFNEAIAAAGALGFGVHVPEAGSNIYHPQFRWDERIRSQQRQIMQPQPTSSGDRHAEMSSTISTPVKTTRDGYQGFIEKTLEYLQSEGGKVTKMGLNLDQIVISGVGVGLPGKHKEIFDEQNVDRILKGENLIDQLGKDKLDGQLDKNIRRLIKKSSGDAEFFTPSTYEEVIRLAGQAGKFDLVEEYHVDEDMASTFDLTTELAVAAGLEALKDAGIPLVREYRLTTTGSFLPGGWVLPDELQDGTGVVFASAFPGFDSFAKEINEYSEKKFRDRSRSLFTEMYGEVSRRLEEGETKSFLLSKLEKELEDLEKNLDDYYFNRKILLNVLSFGHAQFAQMIKAKGPNTQINAACASTTQALGVASDWIRNGRCNRVIIISADNVTSDNLFEWLGSGFLASGAASIKDDVKEAALPFDRRREGMIVGMGAAGLVVESASECLRRGVIPIVEVMGTHYANSAFHGTRLDVHHVSGELQKFLERVRKVYDLTPEEIGRSLMFMSHETYTPRRGGSAAAEIQSLRDNFGKVASRIHIANTKGFTGHPMGAGIEDAIAIKSIEKGQIPPIANFKEPDPDLGNLQLSAGGKIPVDYALRLAAGFGSQIAFALYKKRAQGNRFGPFYDEWLASFGGNRSDLYHHGKTLKMKDEGSPQSIVSTQPVTAKSRQTSQHQTPATISRAEPSVVNADKDSIVERIQGIISEMTGYPVSMLDPELDMEADLGIDTVKQAEIFGVVREEWGIERDDTVQIADYPTIDAVASYFAGGVSSQVPAASTSSSPTSSQALTRPQTSVSTTDSADRSEVMDSVLGMLSEQTGYPVEMLDPELDMEADLGIDTVKQAELFGVIREEFGIQRDDDLVIADYPTIDHVVDFVIDRSPQSTSTEQRTESPSNHESKPQILPQVEIEQSLKDQILGVISSHTGYPLMMLEDSIDLSNDLGIDEETKSKIAEELSENFGGDINKLSVSQTVGDILQILSAAEFELDETTTFGPPEKPTPAESDQSTTQSIRDTQLVDLPEDKSDVFDTLVDIISTHTGYPPEMLDPDLDLEADLGIDTVKQAEIFGQAREQFGIPRIDEMQIADYNTISKLTDFLFEKAGESPVSYSEATDGVTPRSTTELSTHRYVIRMNQSDLESEFSGHGVVIASETKMAKKVAELTSLHPMNSFEDLELEENSTLVLLDPSEELVGDITKLFSLLKHNVDNIERLVLAVNVKEDNPTIHHLTPLQGAIGGMFKALAMEFEIIAKIILFETPQQVSVELSNPEVEVIFSNGNRFVAALSEEDLENTTYQLPKDSILLASGGAQGITFEMIKQIASPESMIFLLGRTEIRDDAEEIANLNPEELETRKWAFMEKLKETEEKVTPVILEKEWSKITKSAKVYHNIETLRKIGSEVHYYSLDITNSKKVKKTFKKLNALIGEDRSITHFVHGAGIEISRPTKSKDEDEFNLIYDVKVKGFENLLNGLRLDGLEKIITFSSIAGRFGNATQVDYSAANEYLAKRCAELNRSGIQSIVIDWSAWADVGMATRGSTLQVLEAQGVTPIPLDQGVQRFIDEFAQGKEVEVIISGELGELASKATWYLPDFHRGIMMDDYNANTLTATRTLSLSKDKYLDDHRIDGKAVLPGVMGLEMMAEVSRAIKDDSINAIFDVQFTSPVKLPHDNDLEIKVESQRIGQGLQLYLRSKFIGPDGQQLGDLRDHFSARMYTGRRMHGFPVLPKKQISSLLSNSRMNQQSIYEMFFHGPSYQIINSVNSIEEGSILTTFKQPVEGMFDDDVDLEILPLAIEAAFQTAGLHLLLTNEVMGLPSSVDAIHFFDTGKPPLLINAIHCNSSNTHGRYNVEVIDEDGNVVIQLLGYSMIFTGRPDFVPEITIKNNGYLNSIKYIAGKSDNQLVSVAVDCLEDVNESFIEDFLTIAEQTRFSGLKLKKKRNEWLAGRIAAKLVLARTEHIPLQEIEILKDENRAPFSIIRGRTIDVSITHSNGIAIAAAGDITVDVEKVETRSKAFIEESFSPEETEKLRLMDNSEENITKYWTMKEAHLKRMRIGLKTDLHGVTIHELDQSQAKVSSPHGVSFCQSYSIEDWILTIALPDTGTNLLDHERMVG